ncbi:2-oxoglutarate and iron-dependent oxygenase [Capsaspora owczarzaki ATCC 30864]|uniref:2-oxoglutarate and iron-dependent oxygenase n=1 Tax=Capsaspora owczarzaki (strain ATCC 30864) TaxID=595528 RepID=A0A0D2W0M6_CAPO3|nr:2-oxoglutarate and iron-dependent oxygenase [Capsaspora owczarzaki ATCC 30864]KJE97777.1 2-oxoglutarate and iron-dependent oxygenase [Capsaspora owczarzaki ATCC 30864]|eukprot:XP_004342963.2 2-oxoglutarate and iron-dependent oxygenase [Capsaspora owczarzaki ATCC 30864]
MSSSKRAHKQEDPPSEELAAPKRCKIDSSSDDPMDDDGSTSSSRTTSNGAPVRNMCGDLRVNPFYEGAAFVEATRALLDENKTCVFNVESGQTVVVGCGTDDALEHLARAEQSTAVGLAHPFHCCSLPLFLDALPNSTTHSSEIDAQQRQSGLEHAADSPATHAYLAQLEATLLCQPLRRKNNDLYNFRQSDDLKNMDAEALPVLKPIMDVLQGPVRALLASITGIELNSNVAMTFSSYAQSDVLLCHDDELDERRIAFILYLSPNWNAAVDGGALDLFDNNPATNAPTSIVASLWPRWNSFNFFPVTETSHHQVAEVFSSSKARNSINGWFHGPPLHRQAPMFEPRLPQIQLGPKPLEDDNLLLSEWLNPVYLKAQSRVRVHEQFVRESSINLQQFLRAEVLGPLMAQLWQLSNQRNRAHGSVWQAVGPPHKRSYDTLADSDAIMPTSPLGRYLRFLRSHAFRGLLAELTGLDRLESFNARELLRRVQSGCYTLIDDGDTAEVAPALDVFLFLPGLETMHSNAEVVWDTAYGGWISYLARDQDEELITVMPTANSLSLVYRTEDALRFVKYVNSTCPHSYLCSALSYVESEEQAAE